MKPELKDKLKENHGMKPTLENTLRETTVEHLGTDATATDLVAYKRVLAIAWEKTPPRDTEDARVLCIAVLEGKHGEWVNQ